MEIDIWLERLQAAMTKLSQNVAITAVADEAWVLGAESWKPSQPVRHTVLAGVHGNEWGGVAGLTTWIENLKECPHPVGVAIGNPKAVRQRIRFTETDLNRAFDCSNPQSYEHRRALELTPLLKKTELLLDLHQTILPSKHPFFIFPWSESSGCLATALNDEVRIVTHRGGGFSKDGKCTDEYVMSQGGAGVTLETGCQGLDPSQIDFAARMIEKFYHLPLHFKRKPTSVVDTLQTVPWREGAKLLPGWENFMPVQKGDVLGSSLEGDLVADVDGAILFPKYPTQNPPPAELCRIVGQAQWYV